MDVINQRIKEEMQILNELKNELRRLPEPEKLQDTSGQIYSSRNTSAAEVHLNTHFLNSDERLIPPNKSSRNGLDIKAGRNI